MHKVRERLEPKTNSPACHCQVFWLFFAPKITENPAGAFFKN
jgi:hypothetical protein